MNSSLKVDNKAIAAMRNELTKELVKTSMSVRELVEQMHEALLAARAQGKTLEQMHQDISRHGVSINLSTFRKYASELLAEDERLAKAIKTKKRAAERVVSKQPVEPLKARESGGLRSLRSQTKGPSLFD
jgi:hypothetical protein